MFSNVLGNNIEKNFLIIQSLAVDKYVLFIDYSIAFGCLLFNDLPSKIKFWWTVDPL